MKLTAPRHWPLSFIVLTALALLTAGVGILALAGRLRGVHPLFNDAMAASLAFLVSAVALFISGLFPLVLRRLAERDH